MEVLIVRHAIAGDREQWTGSDHERPVTAEGRERMAENAAGLRAVAPALDLIATSPLVRAVQTAEVLSDAYGEVEIVTVPALSPGGARDDLRAWLARRREERVALVGHEPDLGELVAWFVFGEPQPAVPLKKGGACQVRFEDAPAPGRGELKWLLPPKILRRLGG
jgi:phosphohistidine phosphatase